MCGQTGFLKAWIVVLTINVFFFFSTRVFLFINSYLYWFLTNLICNLFTGWPINASFVAIGVCWICADVPTPVKDTANNDLFSDFLSSDSQPSTTGNQFGGTQPASVASGGQTSGAQDASLLGTTEQKKATKDAIMALYGTSSVGEFYFCENWLIWQNQIPASLVRRALDFFFIAAFITQYIVQGDRSWVRWSPTGWTFSFSCWCSSEGISDVIASSYGAGMLCFYFDVLFVSTSECCLCFMYICFWIFKIPVCYVQDTSVLLCVSTASTGHLTT